MTRLLRKTISYHDYREDFYHAFLAGIFAGAGYTVESNREHREGRSDVVVYDPENSRVAIFEVKYAQTLKALPSACEAAPGCFLLLPSHGRFFCLRCSYILCIFKL